MSERARPRPRSVRSDRWFSAVIVPARALLFLPFMEGNHPILEDGLLRVTRYVLILVGVCYLPFIAMGPFMFRDPKFPVAMTIAYTLVLLVFCGGIAVVNFAAAWGLARGRRWAWIMGVVLGAVYAPSICFPFGALILWGLLRGDVRKAFLDKAATA